MWQILAAINWEGVGVVVLSILSAYGVTRAWLLKMCTKIESTNLRVEEHRDEIREITARMNTGIEQIEKLIEEYKEAKKNGV